MEAALLEGVTLIVDRYSYSGVAFSAAKGLDVEWCKVTCHPRVTLQLPRGYPPLTPQSPYSHYTVAFISPDSLCPPLRLLLGHSLVTLRLLSGFLVTLRSDTLE